MNRRTRIAAALGAVLLAVLYFSGALSGLFRGKTVSPTAAADAARTAAGPSVSVARVTKQELADKVLVTGTLVARNEVLVSPEIEGQRIVELLAEDGDRVVKGQVLARLERATLESQIGQNDANLGRGRAAIAQAQSAITQAQAKQKEAANAFERAKPLLKSGVLADSTFDTRESTARSAEAAVVSANDGLKLAQADLAQIEAQRRDLDWRLSKTEIRASSDGFISRRNAKVGALASAVADPMFRIVEGSQIELEADVPETQLARLKAGQPARIVAAGAGTVTGTVRLVSAEVDKTTRLGRARIALGDNPNLKVGSFGRGTVTTQETSGLGVPTSAVLYGDGGAYVQVVKDGRVKTQKVVTGLQSGSTTEIRSGVAEGDVVVAKSGTFLRDGDAVRGVEAAVTTASEAR
jgi:RND family efflux transporter MFP subunit